MMLCGIKDAMWHHAFIVAINSMLSITSKVKPAMNVMHDGITNPLSCFRIHKIFLNISDTYSY